MRGYINLLKWRRTLVVSIVAVCVLASVGMSLLATPVYQSETRIELVPLRSDAAQGGPAEELLSPAWVRSQVAVATTGAVLGPAAESVSTDVETLSESLSVDPVPDTQLAVITVRHSSPEKAAEWADAVAQSFTQYRRARVTRSIEQAEEHLNRLIEAVDFELSELDGRSGVDAQRENLELQRIRLQARLMELPDPQTSDLEVTEIVTAARVPDGPAQSNLRMNLALSVVLGSLLGVSGALLAEHLEDRVRTPEQIEERSESTALGYIPYVKSWKGKDRDAGPIVTEENTPASDAFKTLATNLATAADAKRPLCILVTSAAPDAGKTTVSANLAAVLAQRGNRVTVVDADLRHPGIHRSFGLRNESGITEIVHSETTLSRALQQTEFPNLQLLPAGALQVDTAVTLGSRTFLDLLDELKATSDVVILDSAQLLGPSDASELVPHVHAVILVVNVADAKAGELSRAAGQVAKAGGQLTGCVVNGLLETPEAGANR